MPGARSQVAVTSVVLLPIALSTSEYCTAIDGARQAPSVAAATGNSGQGSLPALHSVGAGAPGGVHGSLVEPGARLTVTGVMNALSTVLVLRDSQMLPSTSPTVAKRSQAT